MQIFNLRLSINSLILISCYKLQTLNLEYELFLLMYRTFLWENFQSSVPYGKYSAGHLHSRFKNSSSLTHYEVTKSDTDCISYSLTEISAGVL